MNDRTNGELARAVARFASNPTSEAADALPVIQRQHVDSFYMEQSTQWLDSSIDRFWED